MTEPSHTTSSVSGDAHTRTGGEANATVGWRQRRGLPELAHQAILEMIVNRSIAPGARLNTHELAINLGMSATPVREALSRAVAQRLVVHDKNRGFTVAQLLREHEYYQLFEVRRLLEVHALQHLELDQLDVEQLVDLVESMASMGHGPNYRDFEEFNQADFRLHAALTSSAQNEYLTRAWTDLHFHLHMGRLYAGVGVIDFRDAVKEHQAIIDALQRGDLQGVVDAASFHIGEAAKRLKELVPSKTSHSVSV